MVVLKHLCRYLKAHPRLVQCIPSGVHPAWELQTYVDSDWAGCRHTRKSTNGGCMVLNGACLKTWSTTQAVRALSSAEAEYYAALKGASMALGFRRMAADLGENIKLVRRTDSSVRPECWRPLLSMRVLVLPQTRLCTPRPRACVVEAL